MCWHVVMPCRVPENAHAVVRARRSAPDPGLAIRSPSRKLPIVAATRANTLPSGGCLRYIANMAWNVPNILTVLRLLSAPALALVFVVLPRPAADWVALGLFVAAAATDWCDGYLARRWNQTSRFGAMLDPIADKAMVITALALLVGLFQLDAWLLVPATVILFREVFVSGLREYLGADAKRLQVTRLAKWKTTAQMVSITLLLLSLGLGAHDSAVVSTGGSLTGVIGLALFWVAAGLTLLTGWDYFRKSLPFLTDPAPEPDQPRL